MGIFSKIFRRNNEDQEKVGGMNDYMTLVRVYFQAVLRYYKPVNVAGSS